MEDYLKFIEEDGSYNGYNRFQKVLMAVKRAKFLYDRELNTNHGLPLAQHTSPPMPTRVKPKSSIEHKPTYRAMLEIGTGAICIAYEEKK